MLDNKLINRFLDDLENNRKSINTIKAYKTDLNNFLQFHTTKTNIKNINDNDILNITNDNIEDYKTYLKNKSASTTNRRLICLIRFFKYLKDKKGLIKNNPMDKIDLVKLPKNKKIDYLNINESISLLDNALDDNRGINDIRNYGILTIFLHCGLRISEVIDLNLDSIQNNVLNVIGKGNKLRYIPLDETSMKAINEYLKYRPTPNSKDSNALFISERGNRISQGAIRNLIDKYVKKTGIREHLSPHKLRHTFATSQIKAGTNTRVLQDILGHSDIATTMIYTHIDNDDKRNAINNNPLNIHYQNQK